ncbi:MAG: hypothetical protein F4Y45_15605 [Acidobacteria bacterium]|nr:hypothetical protein [Acidobacteriota bacterium]MYJ03269.1 hypothetical protein [Acidobacteriota bacterium]
MVPFKVGDKVIYPNQGIGVIERIETRTIMGTTCGFYSLRMTSSETTVMVPVDNVDDVGLRRAIGDHEVRRLFTLLGNGRIENHQNWKGRFKENSNKMRTGSLYDVVEVLKSLNHLSQSKNLSFREKRMLDRAKFLVVTELSEVLSEPGEAMEKRVNKALERCVANWKRLVDDPAATATAAADAHEEQAIAPAETVVKKKPAKATFSGDAAAPSTSKNVGTPAAAKDPPGRAVRAS